MDDYCNGCGAEGRPLTQKPDGLTVCDDCRYEELWAA